MAGRTLQTTAPIRSTTWEKSSVRVYCRSATSSNRASMAVGCRACSRAARAMTVTGLCSANRSKTSSRTMVPPPWKSTISRCGSTLADVILQLQSPGATTDAKGLLHRLDDRDIQLIIGRVAGHDGGDHGHAQRVEDGRRDLQLGSIGVILAVAELQEPLVGQDLGVGVGRGGVDADQVGGELVDADGVLVQITFQEAEGFAEAEPGEPVGEAIVVDTGGEDLLAEQGGEGALVLGDPGLDVVEAVVGLREDEEEPDGEDLARGERPFPMGWGRDVAVDGGRQVETPKRGPQDRQVGDDFDTQQARFGSVHPPVLTHLNHSQKR